MRAPRVRLTVRGLMVAVALLGLVLGAFRASVPLGLSALGLSGLAAWSRSEERFYRSLPNILTGYYVTCSLTLPFVDDLWFGEIPPLALVQLPKLDFAAALRSGVVMEAIRRLGYSRGSFSPDYATARPYALAIAYLVPLALVVVPVGLRTRFVRPIGGRVALLLVAAAVDYGVTLAYATQRSFSID